MKNNPTNGNLVVNLYKNIGTRYLISVHDEMPVLWHLIPPYTAVLPSDITLPLAA
jgi:hypothetical protein